MVALRRSRLAIAWTGAILLVAAVIVGSVSEAHADFCGWALTVCEGNPGVCSDACRDAYGQACTHYVQCAVHPSSEYFCKCWDPL